MNENLLVSLMSLIILLCVVGALYLRKKNHPTEKDKVDAAKFIDNLSSVFYNTMIDIVNTTDISKYQSLLEMESDVFGKMYDAVWNYVEEEMEKASKEDLLSAMALKVINRDYVSGFCKALVEKYKMAESLEGRWAKQLEEKNEELIEADQKLEEEYSNTDLYNTEEVAYEDLEPAKPVEPTDEELAKLNPPVEEEVLSDEDDTVEVIEDE